MYCRNCGKEIADSATFCPYCGSNAQQEASAPSMRCPKCGSPNVDVQLYQENQGGETVTRTTSKYREKGHGCLWWLLIGWWWWIVDLLLWIFVFPFRFLVQLFKKKKYVGNSTTVSSTNCQIRYKTVHLCKSCGHHWE